MLGLRTKQRGTADNATYFADEFVDDVTSINLQRVDNAEAVKRPEAIRLYVEDELDALVDEQPKLWEAEGERQARPSKLEAADTKHEAAEAELLIEKQRDVVDDARERMMFLFDLLRTYTRRGKYEKARYYVTMWLLLLGDVAGIAGAAIYLGEVVDLAVLQALASGVAAVTSGLVGIEVKDSRRARRRQQSMDDLDEDEATIGHLLRGADVGEAIVKIMALGGIGVACLIAGSVFALRSSTEGLSAGLVFGCLAAAISLASFINAYTYADDIADLLDTVESDYRRAMQRLSQLAKGKGLRKHAQASVESVSIEKEHKLRGEAAAKRMTALKHQVLRQNTGVAGHGYAPSGADSQRVAAVPSADSGANEEDDAIDLAPVGAVASANGHRGHGSES